MRPLASIRSRLLAFTVASLGLTAMVALTGALLVRTTHEKDSRITADVSADLRRSHSALDQLVAAQISLQTLLRQKDPDEIETGIKRYDTTRQFTATQLAGLGDTVQPPFLRLTTAGKAVINDILTGNNSDALQKFVETYTPAMEETVVALRKQAAAVEQAAVATVATRSATTVRTLTIAASIVGLVLAVLAFAAWRFQHAISQPLALMAERLGGAADALAQLSSSVTRSSQTVAEGSSAQAAALEETSSSLEEISSMTQRNADNSSRAKTLATQTRSAADTGAGDMTAMNTAMAAIKESSGNIGKIIKTIDEIAFQTNILALNAAVEAARAGEAGLGFAVVAEEVRSLAQRSAQAARETAEKIEDSITRSEHGAAISTKVGSSLSAIVSGIREVDILVAEIASASTEQSQGLGQILKSVSEMDSVTQTNAASAEESAAATLDMNREVEVLHAAVDELRGLLGLTASIPSVTDPRERLPAAA